MAVRVSLHPFSMGRNKTYMYLLQQYLEGVRSWDAEELKEKTGHLFFKEVVDHGFLIVDKYNNIGRMAFETLGNVCLVICRVTNQEIYSFRELQRALPKQLKWKASKLKNVISFLSNFRKIQTFTLPCSGFTCIVSDDPSVEHMIDEIFSMSDYLEPRFIYRMDQNEGTEELRDLPDIGLKF